MAFRVEFPDSVVRLIDESWRRAHTRLGFSEVEQVVLYRKEL